MKSPKRPKIPLGIRWVLWLKHLPKVAHRPIGCLVVCCLPLLAFAYVALLVWGFSRWIPAGCWDFLRWASVTPLRKLLGMSGLFCTSLAFYWLRFRHRLIYAWTEISFAITGMWLGLESTSMSRAASLSLAMGSVYLLVRGFDNVAAGRKDDAEKYRARTEAAAPAILAEIGVLNAQEPKEASPPAEP